MRNSNLMANAATKDLLVKSLWQEGKRKEAVTVEERYDETDAVLPPALHGHVASLSHYSAVQETCSSTALDREILLMRAEQAPMDLQM
ncbi:hypothetical protein V6N12_016438 [Hibiscus sabdariffa]|uniref:Uncharacterized protein n=1 Tax=Hibiscus sabdariffa TaxID=183260 RepID=A0ABR2CDM1_9ROSI